jgi:hypothetical protein
MTDPNLNLPFGDVPPGMTLDMSDALLSGGALLLAAVVPIEGGGHLPAVVFRFASADGSGFHTPIMFACDDPDHLDALVPLLQDAIAAAKAAAKREGGR